MVLNIQETKEMNVKEHQGVEYIRNIGSWEKDTTIRKLTLFRIDYNTGTGTTSTTTTTITTAADDDNNDEGYLLVSG